MLDSKARGLLLARSRYRLPAITHPLGKYWGQPPGLRDRVDIHDTHVVISAHDWMRLPRYDSTWPTGVYPGKVWRRGEDLCWYGPERNRMIRVVCLRAVLR